jgi:hypothetical protein
MQQQSQHTDPVVHLTPVHTDGLAVTVSTVHVTTEDEEYYTTVIFDDSPGKRHAGRTYGGWTVDRESRRAETAEGAARNHRDAVAALFDVSRG